MILTTGSKGDDVKAWQKFLKSLGHGVEPDGDFGNKTHVATKNFQTKAGLTADGIVGVNTLVRAKTMGFSLPVGVPSNEGTKSAKVTLLSAGHSTVAPRDSGATGNGYIESYLALELRDLVSDLLREKGRAVVEDGSDGESLPLKKAINLARNADVAVEFHWNAASASTATGVEVLCKPKHKALAQKLAKAIGDATGLVLRGDKGWKADNSGQHHRLGFCEANGLIVEVAFISNPLDMKAYQSNKMQVAENLAEALAN
jgi:N-acetylmuramoyl-L-alanine amidase